MLLKRILRKIKINLKPTQVIVLGFFVIIMIGAILLQMPFSSVDGRCIPFIDALFTATSAVCVTGLSTVCTATHWTIFGKIVILILIQIGGLGFISIITTILTLLGQKVTLKERIIIQESFNLSTINGMVSFIKTVVKMTLTIEGIGAIILAIRFMFDYPFLTAICYGVFHSISAFCNAGFDILGETSVMDYSGDYIVMFTIMILILLGGIGFTVLIDVKEKLINLIKKNITLKSAIKTLSLHSKLALCITMILILSGWLFFFVAEFVNPFTLGHLRFDNKLIASLFQSFTLRTAGFFSINQFHLTDASKFVSIIFMYIGGSPGGTAGGLKTVTFGVIVLSVISIIKGNDSVTVFKRTISFTILQKALSVALMMLGFIFISTVIISISESHNNFAFIDILFETTSAIATTGISTGITPFLNVVSKIVLIISMFVGRLGPITIAVALASKKGDNNLIHYPEEKVIVG